MTNHRIAAGMLTMLLAFPAVASNVAVPAGGSGATGIRTDLGYFDAGTYVLVGGGVADLLGGGDGVTRPDGRPALNITHPDYLNFNSDGAFLDHGVLGVAGNNARLGALIGTLSATPTAPHDWFLIGYQANITLSVAGHVYASVNDTYYDNNTGAFNLAIQAVPEPAAILMLCSGLLLLGPLARGRRDKP